MVPGEVLVREVRLRVEELSDREGVLVYVAAVGGALEAGVVAGYGVDECAVADGEVEDGLSGLRVEQLYYRLRDVAGGEELAELAFALVYAVAVVVAVVASL